jgi:signal transduction histidine kinase
VAGIFLSVPAFFKQVTPLAGDRPLFDYRRVWRNAVLGMATVTILPLAILTVINVYQYEKTMIGEMEFPVTRLVSDTRSTMSAFLTERKSALDFIVRDNTYDELADHATLADIFGNMNLSFGGFVDLGVIDEEGIQTSYVGPYDLGGKDYSGQNWFEQVREKGYYISEVFRGYRNVPHFVIAARQELSTGSFYVIRATIDAEQLTRTINSLDTRPGTDVFVINARGVLQTDSARFGHALTSSMTSAPPPSDKVVVTEVTSASGERLVRGHVSIPDTSFILVVTSHARDLLSGWWKLRGTSGSVLLVSALIIFVVVIAVVTYLVESVYEADLRRTMTLHNMEHTNKMASIGRLAAGVAHEINNPLAIIGEKVGLMRDLMESHGSEVSEEKLLTLVDSVLRAVDRCSNITHRLLGFAKHVDVKIEPLDLEATVLEVLEMLGREAEYRNISVTTNVDEDLPRIRSDKGQLQQVMLNIINNAFAAVSDGGSITLELFRYRKDRVSITVTDDGCGISENDLQRIFEPFFSTKKEKGTGLGLSISYGLVQKLKGEIRVQSKPGEGTRFTILLPENPSTETGSTRGGTT